MRRLAPIFLSILIGALAVALGMGLYLHKANTDRARLAQSVENAERAADEARELQERAVREANIKLEAASTEVEKAQLALKTLQEERDVIARATPLAIPRTTALRGWKDVINLPLGVSLKIPGASFVDSNDANGVAVSADGRWLTITPWSESAERALSSLFVSSTPVSYLVDERVLIGSVGHTSATGTESFILKVRSGTQSFLIWATDPDTLKAHKTLLQVFATLDFKS